MAHWGRECLGSTPQNLCQRLAFREHIYNPAFREVETGGSPGFAGQPVGDFQWQAPISNDNVLRKKCQSLAFSWKYTHVSMNIQCIHTSTHTHTHRILWGFVGHWSISGCISCLSSNHWINKNEFIAETEEHKHLGQWQGHLKAVWTIYEL